jgi:ABC-type branched-subunit amino acid transport system substrate-binding protein
VLDAGLYPPKAQALLRRYRAVFGLAPTAYTLYGYEAMDSILAAIRAAGSQGGDRASVVRAYFRLGTRDSVIGRYSVTATGDTTLANLAAYRVGPGGQLRLDRILSRGG